MFSFVKSVLPVFLGCLAFASAAVVTLGTATDGSNKQAIFTLGVDGTVISQVPIDANSQGAVQLNFAVDPIKNLFYTWNPWDISCSDCLYSFDLIKGGPVIAKEPLRLPYGCMEATAIATDPKQNRWFFGCQASFIIMKGSAIQQFPLSFAPKSMSYDSYNNRLYAVGSGYVNQYDFASNTSTTFKIPPTDVVTLSNVVGTPSGQAYIAGHFFNSNQGSYELEWFTIGKDKKNWLVPAASTELKQHQVLGSAAFDADSQSIVWLDASYLFKYNIASGQITAHSITYKNQFLPWLSSLGVVSLNL